MKASGNHWDDPVLRPNGAKQKRDDTFNKNLQIPIREFPDDVTLGEMRQVTGKISEEDVRRAARRMFRKPARRGVSLPDRV